MLIGGQPTSGSGQSVALGNRPLPVNFRYAPFATEVVRQSKMSRCATMYGPAVRYKMDF
jgi:hypothetical protein